MEKINTMGNYDFTKQPSLLIQGAMDTETAYFIEHLEEHECVTIGNWKFHTGFLGACHHFKDISGNGQCCGSDKPCTGIL